jgi:hypothetical protein
MWTANPLSMRSAGIPHLSRRDPASSRSKFASTTRSVILYRESFFFKG